MAAVLDLTWSPTRVNPTPPSGQAPALYRNSTYSLTFRLFADAAHQTALEVDDAATFSAQLRLSRLTADETPGDPLAEALTVVSTETVTVDAGTIDVTTVTMSFSKEQTKDLPVKGFWDMDMDIGDVRDTLFSGRYKVLNDVTREA